LTLDGAIGGQSAIAGLTPVNFDAAAAQTPTPCPGPRGAHESRPPGATDAHRDAGVPAAHSAPRRDHRDGRASVGASYVFSHKVVGLGSVSYGASGGLDYYSQAVSPPSRGPGADASVTYTLDLRNALSTSANTSYITTLATPAPTS